MTMASLSGREDAVGRRPRSAVVKGWQSVFGSRWSVGGGPWSVQSIKIAKSSAVCAYVPGIEPGTSHWQFEHGFDAGRFGTGCIFVS